MCNRLWLWLDRERKLFFHVRGGNCLCFEFRDVQPSMAEIGNHNKNWLFLEVTAFSTIWSADRQIHFCPTAQQGDIKSRRGGSILQYINWKHVSCLNRLPVHRLSVHRLPVHRLPVHRLPVHCLPVHRLPVHRLDVWHVN